MNVSVPTLAETDALFDAMEWHGDMEGTEAQLTASGMFLRMAFEAMTPEQRTAFMNTTEVVEFLKENGDTDEG